MIEEECDAVAGPHTMMDWDLAALDAIARKAGATYVSVEDKVPLIYGEERTSDRAYMQKRYISGNVGTLKQLGLLNGKEKQAMTGVKTTLFTGVNSGYSNQIITDHSQAVDTVNKVLSFAKRSGGGDPNQFSTHPALVVYDPALSCPPGGEIAVAVTTDGKLSGVVETTEKLRAQLGQSSLSVSGAAEEGTATTKGLKIETKGDMSAIAKIWQDKATEVKNATVTAENPYGTYVSVGVCNIGNGHILIQGEANPRYFPTNESKHAWEDAAKKVVSAVAAAVGENLKPEFRTVDFNYLRAQGKANSRGESN